MARANLQVPPRYLCHAPLSSTETSRLSAPHPKPSLASIYLSAFALFSVKGLALEPRLTFRTAAPHSQSLHVEIIGIRRASLTDPCRKRSLCRQVLSEMESDGPNGRLCHKRSSCIVPASTLIVKAATQHKHLGEAREQQNTITKAESG